MQMSIGKYKVKDTQLRTRGINTTNQHFQMGYIHNFVLAQGAQKFKTKLHTSFESVDVW